MSRNAGGLDPDALSRPERALYRLQSRSVVARVIAGGGCYFCTHRNPRTEGWGRALCGKLDKPTPQFLREGCTFNPDPDRIPIPQESSHEQ